MTNNSREGMGQTKTWGKPQFDEVCSQTGFCRNHPKVCHDGKAEAAADSGALNGRNHGCFSVKQSNRLGIEGVGIRRIARLLSF